MTHENKCLREESLEREIRAYLTTPHQLQYGGLVNLLTTISTICEQQGENTGGYNWFVAADSLKKQEQKLDLFYAEDDRDKVVDIH